MKLKQMDDADLQLLSSQIKYLAGISDVDGFFPEHEFSLLKKRGFLALTLPGGILEFGKGKTADLLQTLKFLGKASLPVGRIYEGHINALHLIHLYATDIQKKKWFHDVTAQKLFGVWNTEDRDGVKIHALGNDQFRLEGCKTFCSGAGWIDRPLVTGEMVTKNGMVWQMCIIPTEKVKKIISDERFWKPLGMRASASFKMDFSGIVIDRDDLLGAPGDYYKQPYFSGGAIRFAAVQLGGAEAVLEQTHHYLRSLKRTEDVFQRARVAEIGYLIETGNLWIGNAAAKSDVSNINSEAELLTYINMARTVIEEICLRSMQLSERSVGARGLLRPNALERIHRDLTTYLRQPAPDATLTSIGEYMLNQESTHNIWKKPRIIEQNGKQKISG